MLYYTPQFIHPSQMGGLLAVVSMKKTVKERIIEALKKKDMSVRELAEELKKPDYYIRINLYYLEAKGMVERKEWRGYWVWGLVDR